MLLKMAWESRRTKLWDDQHVKLMARHESSGYVDHRPWVHQLVGDLIHTKYFRGRAAALGIQLVAGTAPTGEWLHRHRWKTTGKCACGQWDSVDHRLQGCAFLGQGCPVRIVRTLGDCWTLLEEPVNVPARIHPEGQMLAYGVLFLLTRLGSLTIRAQNANCSHARLLRMAQECGRGGECWPQ